MALWPVYLWREMHEDMGRLFAVGDVVSWDVTLIDGDADGWPSDVLVDTWVRIEQRPEFARSGRLARTSSLALCWEGEDPVGSEFQIRAGMVADYWNPPFWSTVTGTVRRIEIVTRATAQDQRGMWIPTGEWVRRDVQQSPRWLARRESPPAAREDGFLAALDVLSHEIRPFPARARSPSP